MTMNYSSKMDNLVRSVREKFLTDYSISAVKKEREENGISEGITIIINENIRLHFTEKNSQWHKDIAVYIEFTTHNDIKFALTKKVFTHYYLTSNTIQTVVEDIMDWYLKLVEQNTFVVNKLGDLTLPSNTRYIVYTQNNRYRVNITVGTRFFTTMTIFFAKRTVYVAITPQNKELPSANNHELTKSIKFTSHFVTTKITVLNAIIVSLSNFYQSIESYIKSNETTNVLDYLNMWITVYKETDLLFYLIKEFSSIDILLKKVLLTNEKDTNAYENRLARLHYLLTKNLVKTESNFKHNIDNNLAIVLRSTNEKEILLQLESKLSKEGIYYSLYEKSCLTQELSLIGKESTNIEDIKELFYLN